MSWAETGQCLSLKVRFDPCSAQLEPIKRSTDTGSAVASHGALRFLAKLILVENLHVCVLRGIFGFRLEVGVKVRKCTAVVDPRCCVGAILAYSEVGVVMFASCYLSHILRQKAQALRCDG